MATERYKEEEIKEKMEILKANTMIDGNGKINIQDFLNNLIEEGIIIESSDDITNNEDGTYTITTNDGYIMDISKSENGTDIEIEYVGKGEVSEVKINSIKVISKTTNSINVEVDASNSSGAKYTYSYKKEDEEEYHIAKEKTEENTYKYENLEANKVYNIKVEVENRGIKKEEIINVLTEELPIGAITIGEVVWENGKAKVNVNINKEIQENLRLEYKINEGGNWTTI